MGDISELTQLALHERRARDRGWWQQMRDCFLPEATVRLSWFRGSAADFCADHEKMSVHGVQGRHRNYPPAVDVDGDRATVEVPMIVELYPEIDGVAAVLSSYIRMFYRAERRSGAWRILSMDAIYERESIEPDDPRNTLSLKPEMFVARPSYTLMAYALGKDGLDVGTDLYGDDEPGAVAQFYSSVFAWLHGTDDQARLAQ